MTTPDAPLDPKNDPNLNEGRFGGIYPDNSYPLVDGTLDMVQEMKLQARQEGDRTRRVSSDAPRDPHPPFTEEGPDRIALGRWADENNNLTPGKFPDGSTPPPPVMSPDSTTTTTTDTTTTTEPAPADTVA